MGLPLSGAPRPDFYVYLVLVRHINTQTSIQYVEYYSLLTSPKATYLGSDLGGIRVSSHGEHMYKYGVYYT